MLFSKLLMYGQLDKIRQGLKDIEQGLFIDYKEDIPSDLPKIVASFANTRGGHIVIGVVEDRTTNKPIRFPGLDASSDLKNKVRNIIVNNINPIPRFEICLIPHDQNENKVLVVIEVPESRFPPHILNNGRIYRRNDSGSDPIERIRDRYTLEKLFEKCDRYKLAQQEEIDALLIWPVGDDEYNCWLKLLVHPEIIDSQSIPNFFHKEVYRNVLEKCSNILWKDHYGQPPNFRMTENSVQLWMGQIDPTQYTFRNARRRLEVFQSGIFVVEIPFRTKDAIEIHGDLTTFVTTALDFIFDFYSNQTISGRFQVLVSIHFSEHYRRDASLREEMELDSKQVGEMKSRMRKSILRAFGEEVFDT